MFFFVFQAASLSSSGQFEGTWLTLVAAAETVRSTRITGTSVSTADSRSASRWGWGKKVQTYPWDGYLPWIHPCPDTTIESKTLVKQVRPVRHVVYLLLMSSAADSIQLGQNQPKQEVKKYWLWLCLMGKQDFLCSEGHRFDSYCHSWEKQLQKEVSKRPYQALKEWLISHFCFFQLFKRVGHHQILMGCLASALGSIH